MSGSFCEESSSVRREASILTRQRIAEILEAPEPARLELATRAIAELHGVRLLGMRRLPVAGCGGEQCLQPFFTAMTRRLEAVGDSQDVLLPRLSRTLGV